MNDLFLKFMNRTGCKQEEAESYLEEAEMIILSETRRSKMIDQLNAAKYQLALILYNRNGSEGESSRSEGGVSITFEDIPKATRNMIAQYRLARCGGHAFEKKETTTSETTQV